MTPTQRELLRIEWGRVKALVHMISWKDWNVTFGILPLAAGFGATPGVHAMVALVDSTGYTALHIGPKDVSGAAETGGTERRFGPFTLAKCKFKSDPAQ
jgi:hypothetical protein